VQAYHARRRQALGAGGPHIILAQDFEHRGTRHPRDDGERNGAQHDGGQHEMMQRVQEGAVLADSSASTVMKPVTGSK